MTFLTNKPINNVKDITCKMSGFSFDEIDKLDIPKQIVIDISKDYPTRSLEQLVRHFNCQYIESPVELNSNNVVYFVQEGQHSIIKIEAL